MLSTLKARRPSARDGPDNTSTKDGIFIFNGQPSDFHEWEFRTLMRVNGTNPDDLPNLASRIIQGLRDDAFLTATDLGIEVLSKEDGVNKLVEAMRDAIFCLRKKKRSCCTRLATTQTAFWPDNVEKQ